MFFASPSDDVLPPAVTSRPHEVEGKSFNDIERLMASSSKGDLGRFHFALDGVPYEIEAMTTDKPHVSITAVLGYLPFTTESSQKRQSILTILMATRRLPTVQFRLDYLNRITASATYETSTQMSAAFIFYPLICFQQEAKPFIDVIANYL